MPPESAPSTAPRRIVAGATLSITLLAGILPGAVLAGDPAADQRPGAHYEEALAHADDEISFVPGDRVRTGFAATSRKLATVGTRAVTRLPAGLLSGREMAAGKTTAGRTAGAKAAAGDSGASPSAMPRLLAEQSPAPTDALPPPSFDPNASPGASPDASPGASATPTPSPDPAATPVPTPVPTPLPAPTTPGSLRKQVIGFLPYWELNSSTLTLRYELLSTIAYFSVGSDTDGNLLKYNSDGSLTTGWAGWTSSRMTSIIEAAHAAGTRVVLTVTMFAWSSTERSRQAALLANPDARANLARQLAGAVRDRGADGVNVDFEPIVSGYGDEFTDFVRRLRAELDAIAPGYEITVDTTGYVGNYELANLVAPGAADAIFLMGYDFRTSGALTAGAIAPIAGPLFDVGDAVRNFLNYIPPSALILGVPYYGRAWSTVSDAPNAQTQTGTRYGSSVTAEYQTAATLAEENGRRYDELEQSAWVAYRKQNCSSTYGCVTTWRETYYDDAQSLGAKYDLVNQLGLRGMGMWALGYDGRRPELWNVLADKFLVPTIPTEQPSISFDASASAINWASQVALIATLRGQAAGALVDVQQSRDGATWLPLVSLPVGADGTATHLITPHENRYYRAVVPGTTDPSGTSNVKRVVVRSVIAQRPLLSSVKVIGLGSTLTFRTLVRPARVDTPIPNVRFVAYRLVSGRWALQATQDVTPTPDGWATFVFSFSARGGWYVRSMAVPTPMNANSEWGPVLRYNVR